MIEEMEYRDLLMARDVLDELIETGSTDPDLLYYAGMLLVSIASRLRDDDEIKEV